MGSYPTGRWSEPERGTLARQATVPRSGPEKNTAGKSARAPKEKSPKDPFPNRWLPCLTAHY